MLAPAIRRDLILGSRESPAARAARYGLVAAWNLDEVSGARADSFGANHLTDNNTVTSNPGKVGLAGQFTAANSEYLSIADNAALSTGDIDFWISLWVYLDSVGANRILAQRQANPGAEYVLRYQHSALRFAWTVYDSSANAIGSRTAATLGQPSTATWYHLFAYHDAVNNLVGAAGNGGVFDTAATTGVPTDTASTFALGADTFNTPGTFHNGRIDAVAFGKSPPGGIAALAAEIRDYFYNGGAGRLWSF